jgi:hypothetical protein
VIVVLCCNREVCGVRFGLVFWGAGSVDTALAGQYEKAAEITSDARSISRIPNLSDLHIEIPSASGASNPN